LAISPSGEISNSRILVARPKPKTSFYLCYPARRQASPALCALINYLLGMWQAR
jgi:DNA-binding transcriptional LysR family regulator